MTEELRRIRALSVELEVLIRILESAEIVVGGSKIKLDETTLNQIREVYEGKRRELKELIEKV